MHSPLCVPTIVPHLTARLARRSTHESPRLQARSDSIGITCARGTFPHLAQRSTDTDVHARRYACSGAITASRRLARQWRAGVAREHLSPVVASGCGDVREV